MKKPAGEGGRRTVRGLCSYNDGMPDFQGVEQNCSN